MSRYEKISSGSGSHGVKYGTNLLSYYLLKAYMSNEDFQLSAGDKIKLMSNHIVLESNTYTIFAQAKHIDNKSKKITKSQLFAENGKYSLYVYLRVVFSGIYQQLLRDIHKHVEEELMSLKESKPSQETSQKAIETLYKDISVFTQVNSCRESSFENFILSLQKVNIDKLNSLLKYFNNTSFHLVTNIFPNEELSNFKIENSPDAPLGSFEEFEEVYNFNTNEVLKEFLKIKESLNIPEWFIKLFLGKTYLIVTSNEVLQSNIDYVLKELSLKREISHEIRYSNIYSIIEEWQANKEGVYLTRTVIDDVYFASLINKTFKQELKSYERFLEFNLEILLSNMKKKLLTIVETQRYLPIMTAVQKKFVEDEIFQTIFVNPLLNIDNQRFLMKAFLHEKYTHLVCVLQNGLEDLLPFFLELIKKIEKNDKYILYKKVILFCDKNIEMWRTINEIILRDHVWFKERKLNIERLPKSLCDMENYYVERELTYGSIIYSEEEFLNKLIERKQYVVISDSPGMGKTTLLASLAVKINRKGYYWPLIIYLNNFTEIFEKHLEANTVPLLDDFINTITYSSLERQICQISDILLVMIDGFDEISPDYSDIVKEFLNSIYSTGNVQSVIVTTRNHTREYLENNLKAESFKLQPMSGTDICSLIYRYGKQNFDTVSYWFDSLPQNIQKFFVVPLHVKMFVESCEQNKNLPKVTSNINLYQLYEDFFNKKQNIFIKEKCNCQGNVHVKRAQNEQFNNLLEIFMQLALQMTFKKELLEELGATGVASSVLSEEMCANGILEFSDKKIRFIHETFKEFLVAKWMLRRLLNFDEYSLEKIEVMFKKIFMKSYGSKNFINSYLEKNWTSITNECLKKFGNIVCKNSIFSDILYVNYDFPFIIRLMVEKCENQLLLNKIFIDLISLGSEQLLQKVLMLLLINKGIDARSINDKGKTILHVAAEEGNFELVQYLVENNICYIDECDIRGLTSTILALFENNFDISEYLIAHGAHVTDILKSRLPIVYDPSTRKVTIHYGSNYRLHKYRVRFVEANWLHIAAFQGSLQLFEYVLSQKVCSLHDKTSENDNVLHCAVESGNLEFIKFIISLGVDPHDTTYCDETVLHLAVANDNIDLVKFFVELNVKIEAENNYGQTALAIASMYSQWNIILYLLEVYVTLKCRDISSVYKALCVLLQRKEYNDFFKRVHGKFAFSSNMKSSLLEEAIRYNNTDIKDYLSKSELCNIM